MKILLILLTFSALCWGQKGTSLLMNTDGEDIDLSSSLKQVKQLKLDDAFLIQLFGKWKAAGALSPDVNTWVNLILSHNFEKALTLYPKVKGAIPQRFLRTAEVAKLYLLRKEGYTNSFVKGWITQSSEHNILKSEIGLALDHVVSKDITKDLIQNGVLFTENELLALQRFENTESKINYVMQSFKALRTGKNATRWIGKLDKRNPLRLRLAYTSLIEYSKENKLKASAKLIKKVVEPVIEKTDDIEEISLYYLTLARLLYQAKAFGAATEYYSSIPQSSKYFLTAQSEQIWANLLLRDYPAVKGALATLKLEVFEDKFYPEIYLVSSIANLKTCQFLEVKDNFKEFLSVNKEWAKRIEKNIKDKNPALVSHDFFTENLIKVQKSIDKEEIKLLSLKNDFWSQRLNSLKELKAVSQAQFSIEKRRRWENRKVILEDAIYKMRFVKVEFISQMRDFSMKLSKGYEDSVSTYAAANARNNQLRFKADRVLWADELFNSTAQVENLCLQGRGL